MRTRRARIEDWEEVRPFCTRTFSWGDYIEEVWDRWVDGGNLLVYEGDGGTVDGIINVSVTGREAWLEGERVRPEARRHGIGSFLISEAEEIAVEMGAAEARVAIESTNGPSLGMIEKAGYARESDWYMYSCEPAPGGCGRVSAAPRKSWPSRYVESWMWVPAHDELPRERVVWVEGGPAAVLADSSRFPGVLMATVSFHMGGDAGAAACMVDYAAGVAHRTGQDLQVFSTHPVMHAGLSEREYRVRILVKDLVAG